MGIIGIFGTGGIGKTTVLKNIHTELIKNPLNFDVLIFARVSQVPNIDKIQDEIRRSLGILDHLWKKKSPEERTRDISIVLSKTKFVLLLDDIWPGFDFAQVGVPLPKESQNKSKVVFTTRSEEVCNHMNTDQRFRIEALPEEEGRTLFSKTVGEDTFGSNHRIKDLAMNIADKCGVLPLAIVTIGGVLAKHKDVEVWEETLNQLHESNLPEFSGMIEILYRNLTLSYGLLEDETTKSCFKYCSLLPKVDLDQLIDYWIREGFLESKLGVIDDSRDRGYTITEGLLKASLLMAEDCYRLYNRCILVVRNYRLDYRMHVIRNTIYFLISRVRLYYIYCTLFSIMNIQLFSQNTLRLQEALPKEYYTISPLMFPVSDIVLSSKPMIVVVTNMEMSVLSLSRVALDQVIIKVVSSIL